MNFEFPFLDQYPVILPVLIFCTRIMDVSIGTLRLICVTRGRRGLAVVLGFFEVLLWIFAMSSVFAHLDSWINILAFAAGFATGNAVGMAIEKKMAMGTQIVSLISRGSAHAVAERLRFADMVVTTLSGSGRFGPVSICLAIVPRRRTQEVLRMAREIDPEVVITIEDAVDSSIAPTPIQYPGKVPSLLGSAIGRLRSQSLPPTIELRPPSAESKTGVTGVAGAGIAPPSAMVR